MDSRYPSTAAASAPQRDDLGAILDSIAMDESMEQPPSRKYAYAALGCMAGLFGILFPFLAPALRKQVLPYIPATPQQIDHVMGLARTAVARRATSMSGKLRVIDLGSGDGRVAIEAAKTFPEALVIGVELNPWLVIHSRLKAYRHGVASRTRFMTTDLWKHDLSAYDVIVVFGVKEMMPALEAKMLRELNASASVISTRFALPTWTFSDHQGLAWLYYAKDQSGMRSISDLAHPQINSVP